jgi:hypothetical protein
VLQAFCFFLCVFRSKLLDPIGTKGVLLRILLDPIRPIGAKGV